MKKIILASASPQRKKLLKQIGLKFSIYPSRAEELQHYAMFHDNIAEINSDLDKFMAVTNDDIRRVAGKYLDSANAVILIIKPAGGSQ